MRKYSNAAKVEAMREERVWSQEQLAAVSGVSVRTIQRIERGNPASFESLKAIAAAFEVDVKELLDAASPLYLFQECSPVVSMSSEYLHTDTQRLENWHTDLKHRHASAKHGVQHARTLHLDRVGPINAAEAEVIRLSAPIAQAERLIERVRTGCPYCDKREFEDVIDLGEDGCGWQELSDVPAPGTILGHDNISVRLPVNGQDSYAQAVSTRLFDAFELCTTWETSSDDGEPEKPFKPYLFGPIQSVEVILKCGEAPLLFHDITHAHIGNDGRLRLERAITTS